MNKKGIAMVVIILSVVLILAVAGGIWYYKLRISPSVSMPIISVSTTTISFPVSYDTYTDKNRAFSIQYPKGFSLGDQAINADPAAIVEMFNGSADNTRFFPSNSNPSGLSMHVDYASAASETSCQQSTGMVLRGSLTLGGVKWYLNNTSSIDVDYLYQNDAYQTYRNGICWGITFNWTGDTQEAAQRFGLQDLSSDIVPFEQATLSAFRVLNSAEVPATYTIPAVTFPSYTPVSAKFETFTDKNNVFSIQYPSGYAVVSAAAEKPVSQQRMDSDPSALVEIDSGNVDLFPNTTLGPVSIFVDYSTSTEAQCENPSTMSGQANVYSLDGVQWYEGGFGSAAMGTDINTDSYQTYQNNACWSISFSWTTYGGAMGEPNIVPGDENSLVGPMLKSFRILKSGTSAIPAAVTAPPPYIPTVSSAINSMKDTAWTSQYGAVTVDAPLEDCNYTSSTPDVSAQKYDGFNYHMETVVSDANSSVLFSPEDVQSRTGIIEGILTDGGWSKCNTIYKSGSVDGRLFTDAIDVFKMGDEFADVDENTFVSVTGPTYGGIWIDFFKLNSQ